MLDRDPRTAVAIDVRQRWLGTARQWCDDCRGFLDTGPTTSRLKSDGSLVTAEDERIEAHLRDCIRSSFPDHGIIGEEQGGTAASAEFIWIIDPIDGSEDFSRGLPFFGSLLSLYYRGLPLLAIIDHPRLDLRIEAAFGLGTHCNGRPLEATAPTMTSEMVILPAAAEFNASAAERRLCQRLHESFGNSRTFRTCYGHSLAITGQADGCYEHRVAFWDLAATWLLVSEAGGEFIWLEEPRDDFSGRYSACFGRRDTARALARIVTREGLSGI